jgi:hypothetical protein
VMGAMMSDAGASESRAKRASGPATVLLTNAQRAMANLWLLALPAERLCLLGWINF